MAYFKRHNRRNKRRHVFGKRKERAIRAIAMGPVETKKWSITALGFVEGAPAAPTTSSVFNVFYNLPKGSHGDTEQTVIGNQFLARGVKFYFQSNNTGNIEIRYRATVFSSTADTLLTNYSIGNNVLNSSPIYEQDIGLPMSLRRFDTQVVRVLKSKTWTVKKNYSEQIAEESFHTMWVPISGKKTSRVEESPGVTTTVGHLKGVNYYVLVEAYLGGALGPVYDWSGANFNFGWTVYFKDP